MFKGRIFQFRLGLPGIAGIGVVLLCIFFWMFLLGIWAGQTIILPLSPGSQSTSASLNDSENKSGQAPLRIIQPAGSKLPVTQ
ncbi:MAG: hypothetical protein OEM02_07765 [Desulfobulbaceae bacterium]|nr:hypothetical protein [Desulfobulbaceae bacterium]